MGLNSLDVARLGVWHHLTKHFSTSAQASSTPSVRSQSSNSTIATACQSRIFLISQPHLNLILFDSSVSDACKAENAVLKALSSNSWFDLSRRACLRIGWWMSSHKRDDIWSKTSAKGFRSYILTDYSPDIDGRPLIRMVVYIKSTVLQVSFVKTRLNSF